MTGPLVILGIGAAVVAVVAFRRREGLGWLLGLLLLAWMIALVVLVN